MKDKTLLGLGNDSHTLRCLDYYGNRPERDAGIVIGILVGKDASYRPGKSFDAMLDVFRSPDGHSDSFGGVLLLQEELVRLFRNWPSCVLQEVLQQDEQYQRRCFLRIIIIYIRDLNTLFISFFLRFVQV